MMVTSCLDRSQALWPFPSRDSSPFAVNEAICTPIHTDTPARAHVHIQVIHAPHTGIPVHTNTLMNPHTHTQTPDVNASGLPDGNGAIPLLDV